MNENLFIWTTLIRFFFPPALKFYRLSDYISISYLYKSHPAAHCIKLPCTRTRTLHKDGYFGICLSLNKLFGMDSSSYCLSKQKNKISQNSTGWAQSHILIKAPLARQLRRYRSRNRQKCFNEVLQPSASETNAMWMGLKWKCVCCQSAEKDDLSVAAIFIRTLPRDLYKFVYNYF